MAEALELVTGFVVSMRAAATEVATTTEAALATALEASSETPPSPRRTDVAGVEEVVRRLLGEHEDVVHGGGFVAAPDLLADAPWWLEWFAWDGGIVQRLVAETDPAGAHFFDYTLMPWFAGPCERPDAEGVVTGPYVDYLCTDDYTVTFSRAVRLPDGTFAGVAGIDVRVMTVEQQLLSALRASGRLLGLVNDLGRVVVSSTSRMLSGELVEEVDVPALFVGGDPRLTRISGSELGLLDLGPR